MMIIANQSTKKFCRVFFLVGCAIGLSGCEMYAPGSLTENKVEVHEKSYHQDILISEMDQDLLNGIAREYQKQGGSPMLLTITYDPHSNSNTAMRATQNASKIAKDLRGFGVADAKIDILPIRGQGKESHVMISYDAYTAYAPQGCKTLPGVDNMQIEDDSDYKMGCTIETMLARQISNPKDLAGQSTSDYATDGRSSANIVDGIRSGAKRDKLDGESASNSN